MQIKGYNKTKECNLCLPSVTLKIYLFACKFRAAKGCDKLLKTNTTFTIYCNSFEALAAIISNRYLIHYKKSIRLLNREPKDYRGKKISLNHSN